MTALQPDLFGAAEPETAAPPVPGIATFADVVDPDEERALIGRIDAAGLAPFRFQGWEGKRLTASFGHSYDFERGRVLEAPPMPVWLEPLRSRAALRCGLDPASLVQALVIRYDPGAGIGWHRDRPQFGTVIGLSLGAPAVLRLRRRTTSGFTRAALPLPPRALYCLDGEARSQWEHSIVPLEQTRWSITFRTMAKPPER
ncbi:alpha-ketoglutarate-dependent dioxygenase AlkB [Novosphingobium tardum]|jgi:hypothetical protein|uniref:Alpha-ketoglutarate-dependent dioxygenase AlkB n=1 Tax=Novosphingobium tardum TaxID=1538021 RepID=A0ABV8RLT7_9SPHN